MVKSGNPLDLKSPVFYFPRTWVLWVLFCPAFLSVRIYWRCGNHPHPHKTRKLRPKLRPRRIWTARIQKYCKSAEKRNSDHGPSFLPGKTQTMVRVNCQNGDGGGSWVCEFIRHEKRAQTQTFESGDVFQWGIKLFWRDIPGFCIPAVPGKFEKQKSLCSIFGHCKSGKKRSIEIDFCVWRPPGEVGVFHAKGWGQKVRSLSRMFVPSLVGG